MNETIVAIAVTAIIVLVGTCACVSLWIAVRHENQRDRHDK